MAGNSPGLTCQTVSRMSALYRHHFPGRVQKTAPSWSSQPLFGEIKWISQVVLCISLNWLRVGCEMYSCWQPAEMLWGSRWQRDMNILCPMCGTSFSLRPEPGAAPGACRSPVGNVVALEISYWREAQHQV